MSQSIPVDGSAFPVPVSTYLAFYANSLLWTSYGLLAMQQIVFLQNLISTLMACFSLYLLYTMKKSGIPKIELQPAILDGPLWGIISAWSFVVLMLVLMCFNELIFVSTLGRIGMILAIAQFAAPLIVMKQVLSQGYNGGLLDPQLSMLLLIMGVLWSVYGNAVADPNIIIPNFIGALLSAVQVFLNFVVPPTKDGWPTCHGKACCQHNQAPSASPKMEV